MLNRVILIGRLTRDPEFKRTASGVGLTNFTLAVDRKFQAAGKEKETDFIRIVAWDKLAELCKEYLGKGHLTAIEGRLQVRKWETPEGERRTIFEVRADDVRFLERASSRKSSSREDEPPLDSYDDEYDGKTAGDGRAADAGKQQGPDEARETPESAPPPKAPATRDYGGISDKKLDEEIDLDDDDPFKEEF